MSGSLRDDRARLAELLAARQAGGLPEAYPLSHGQQGLWLIHQRDPGSATWNEPVVLRISPALDLAAFTRALGELLDRHPVLRSTYALSGQTPVQRVGTGQPVPLQVTDAAAWSEEELDARLDEQICRPFDLTNGPVFRALIFRRGPAGDVLLLVAHHIALDGMSYWTALDDLFRLYQSVRGDRSQPVPAPAAHYHQYVRWQRELLAGPDGHRLREYWERQLRGAELTSALPRRTPSVAGEADAGGSYFFELDQALLARLRELARSRETTMYALLVAAYQLLLHRYGSARDILVSSPVNDRVSLGPAYEGMVGYCANQVLLRSRLDGNPRFSRYLDQVHQTVLEALKHHCYPFSLLAPLLSQHSGTQASAIGEIAFSMPPVKAALTASAGRELVGHQTVGGAHLTFGDVTAQIVPRLRRTSKYALLLEIYDGKDQTVGVLTYRYDMFDQREIERMAIHFQRVLEQVAADPQVRTGDIELLSAAERAQILGEWNAAAADVPAGTLAGLVEAQAARTPGAIAVVCGERRVAYGELNAAANRLARLLVWRWSGRRSWWGRCWRWRSRGRPTCRSTWATPRSGSGSCWPTPPRLPWSPRQPALACWPGCRRPRRSRWWWSTTRPWQLRSRGCRRVTWRTGSGPGRWMRRVRRT